MSVERGSYFQDVSERLLYTMHITLPGMSNYRGRREPSYPSRVQVEQPLVERTQPADGQGDKPELLKAS